MKKNCKLCGGAMVWEHPEIPGLFLSSSCNIEEWPICHDCMVEHCCQTNCLGCEYGKYPDCRFLNLKKHYMDEDNHGEGCGANVDDAVETDGIPARMV